MWSDAPPRPLLEARDSLGPVVANESASSRPVALAGRVARAGAVGGLFASLVAGVPYYLAVRDTLPLPWLRLAPLFVAFVVACGAVYAAGAAYGVRALARAFRPSGPLPRALVAVVGAALGAALVGPLPGAVGLASFGSLPYPFMGTATLAIAPSIGTALATFALAATTGDASRPRLSARAALATLAVTALFCALGAFAIGTLDDATVVAAFRDATTAAGHEDSPLGLGIVGLFVGALLGVGLGCQMGLASALAGGARDARA